jgi:N-acetylglucosaminyl-diphospho-decaprenol L-rhamnosyltransferase
VDLSIIIVNWNSAAYLRQCLASIRLETRGLEYEIVVIDAGSFDGCDRMLRELYPEVRFIQSEKNCGFAQANNAAFRASQGRSVLFLNPDTQLVGPAINILHEQLQKVPQAGAVGGKLLNADRSIQTSCVQAIPTILNQVLDSECLRSLWPKSALWGMASLGNPADQPAEVEGISGACVMLKRSVFAAVGLFSEDYFMYAEDMDLSDKLRKAGYRNYYVPAATIIHFGGGSSARTPSNFSTVMSVESMWRFFRKSGGNFRGMGYRGAMFCAALGRLALLFLALPVQQIRRRRAGWDNAFKKWRAILRWSARREKWVSQY